ncbi:MAG: DEAD/DEAH box helicase [Bacteroidota bacterium]
MSFKSLSLTDPILRSLNEEGYSEPTPIQAQSIPIALEGRDLLGSAQTGTGKTASFAIPVLQNLGNSTNQQGRKPIRSLVVTPTRELAIQIDDSFKRYGRYTGLSTAVIFGGVNQKSQVRKLKRGVDIVVATPGRLLDLMNQRHLSLSNVEILVLDEADRMLDMGFINDIKKILKAVPKKRQTLFFSATMPPAIVQLSKSMLNNPAKVEIEPESPTVEAIQQGVYHVEQGNKKSLLVSLLQNPDIPSALVFTRTKHGANKVVTLLNKRNIGAEAIHGNKSQAARQKALGNFKDQKTRVLVATDIASRGIDVDELKYVINFDLPNEAETYVHRIGRTGRAGADGTALSFCDTSERSYLRDIEKLIAKRVPVVEHPELTMAAPAPGRGGGGGGQRSRSKSNRQQRSRRPKSSNRQRNRR